MFLEQQISHGKMEARKHVMRVAITKALTDHVMVLDRRGECSFSVDHSKDPILEEVIGEFSDAYEILVVAHAPGETHLWVRRTQSAVSREVFLNAESMV